MAKEIKSILRLDHLVFDKISFQRVNFLDAFSQDDIDFQFSFGFEERDSSAFVVHVGVEGHKKDEYNIEVHASGYFTSGKDEALNNILMRQNAVAIIFPYIRSQISLLTAQPEMVPVTLPPLNIAKMVEEASAEADNNENA